MNVTEYVFGVSPVSDSSKLYYFPSANQVATFCELDLYLQLGVLRVGVFQFRAQPDQLEPLGLVQWRVNRDLRCLCVAFLLHPFPKAHLMDTDAPGHLGDRPAALHHEGNRLGLVLIGEATSRGSHGPYPSREGQLNRLSGKPGTVQGSIT